MRQTTAPPTSAGPETTVEHQCTGHVRSVVGPAALEFSFDGEYLRAFLEAFFDEYVVRDMILAETEAEATEAGRRRWTDIPASGG